MTNQNSTKLYRSNTNAVLGGVCSGLAEHFGLKIGMLRLITLILILAGGLSLWVYIILWILIPKKQE